MADAIFYKNELMHLIFFNHTHISKGRAPVIKYKQHINYYYIFILHFYLTVKKYQENNKMGSEGEFSN